MNSVAQGKNGMTGMMRGRQARALLACAGAAAVVLTMPGAMLGRVLSIFGLEGAFVDPGDPAGLFMRAAIAALVALLAYSAVLLLWSPGQEKGTAMTQAHKKQSGFGWSAMLRLARGEAQQPDALVRRRADHHPDAPPRAPFSARLDLPPVATASESLEVGLPSPADGREMDLGHFPTAPGLQSAPITDAAPLPRTVPAAEDVALPPARPAAAPSPAAATRSVAPHVPTRALPLIEGADLGALLHRFERGIARREAVAQAQSARETLADQSMFLQQDTQVRTALRARPPVSVVPERGETFEAGPEASVDDALESALATLRELAIRGRR